MTERSQAIPKYSANKTRGMLRYYDGVLITVIAVLLGLGLVMVASSSVAVAEGRFDAPLYYFWRQLTAVMIGVACMMAILKIPLSYWNTISGRLIVFGLLLLMCALIPGLGREVNGSSRWLSLGAVSLQPSELMKVCVVIYLAGYMVRHGEEVWQTLSGFIPLFTVLSLIALLLLLEPDYGSCVLLFVTTLGMLFLGGAPFIRFFLWASLVMMALVCLIVLSPYRLQRLMSFVDPWQDQFDSGFQLTQALIAFGRGDWWGVGLGSSVQKLFYLPEAHTDFVFSIFAEEFGLVGSFLLIALFSALVWRAFIIAYVAECRGQLFAAYLAYGIGLVIGAQTAINMGVNLGVLPTKGLTLPLLSYGMNSVVFTCVMLGILLRVEVENRRQFEGSSG